MWDRYESIREKYKVSVWLWRVKEEEIMVRIKEEKNKSRQWHFDLIWHETHNTCLETLNYNLLKYNIIKINEIKHDIIRLRFYRLSLKLKILLFIITAYYYANRLHMNKSNIYTRMNKRIMILTRSSEKLWKTEKYNNMSLLFLHLYTMYTDRSRSEF